MTRLATLLILLLPHLCRSRPLVASSAVAFVPRGGGLGRSSRGRTVPNAASSSAVAEEDAAGDGPAEERDGGEGGDPPFDLQAVSKKIHDEEVEEIREAQQLLKRQQRRRELDKTWLDRGITAFIEFFENLFSWKVIDV